MIRTTLFATAAMILGAGAASAAKTVVEFDREQLENPAYAEAVYADIESAAYRVCRKELRAVADFKARMATCMERSIEDAVNQVNHPMVTAYANGDAELTRIASTQ